MKMGKFFTKVLITLPKCRNLCWYTAKISRKFRINLQTFKKAEIFCVESEKRSCWMLLCSALFYSKNFLRILFWIASNVLLKWLFLLTQKNFQNLFSYFFFTFLSIYSFFWICVSEVCLSVVKARAVEWIDVLSWFWLEIYWGNSNNQQ